jgi:hypothetical protein
MNQRRVLDSLQVMASLVLLVFAWQLAALAMTLPMQ